jgi:hypothetical protein
MSRRRPSQKKYAETIGQIAIQWNLLERKVNVLGFHYMGGDVEVASRILQGMGSQTREDFIRFLVTKFEPDKKIKEFCDHLMRAVPILRENRNTILHASPINDWSGYQGHIVKPHKFGHTMNFNVPIQVLEELVTSLERFTGYAVQISVCVIASDEDRHMGGPSMREAMKRVLSEPPCKPSLPRKIEPLPIPVDQPANSPKPRVKRAALKRSPKSP